MNSKEKVIIFDTTLRDGEQSPGATLNIEEKVEVARQLSRLGVDVCEAGFPIASNGDFEAVYRIANEVGPITDGRKSGKPMVICGLARSTKKDILRAYEAIKNAPLNRIHIFLATSDLHLKYKLKITREQCIQKAVDSIEYARSLGVTDIEFSPEDAGRTDKQFLVEILGKVIKAGATTLNIPDTVGYLVPEQYGQLIEYLIKNTPGGDKVVWSTHCHNDLGMATANTLSGIYHGARQAEVTINGIGERAGNTSLEEIAMGLYIHGDYYNVRTDIDTTQIYASSQLVIKTTGVQVQVNKAIVGANAYSHESGIHQDGVLKCKETYEIISPELVGVPCNNLVIGKHSGRAAFKNHIKNMTAQSTVYKDVFDNDPAKFETLFENFKKLADSKKKGINNQDLYALMDDILNISQNDTFYTLDSVQIISGTHVLPTATISLIQHPTTTTTTTHQQQQEQSQIQKLETSTPIAADKICKDAAIGQGPVHAVFKAINRLVKISSYLCSYELKAITDGSDALGRVSVKIMEKKKKNRKMNNKDEGNENNERNNETQIQTTDENDNDNDNNDVAILDENSSNELLMNSSEEIFRGDGIDIDVLVASAKAYVNAINKLISSKYHK